MLERWWRDRTDFFIGANLTVFFSREQLKQRDFRGPDFFVATGVAKHPRTSWVVWEEGGKYSDIIIELLSDSTAVIDREIKKELYQDRFRTPEYFWFSPVTLEFCGFELSGRRYREITPDERRWRWSNVLGLYLGVENGLLRYFTAAGDLVPTPEEAELESQFRAEQEAERADREAEYAAKLAAKLRELGIDPNTL